MSRMKLCRTCRYGSEYELDKPCIVYREDCPLYQKEGEEMTNKEAIEELKAIKSAYSNKQQFHEACLMRSEHEALDMAIQALEQEPKTDVLVKIRDEIDAIRPDDYPCNMRIPERIRDMAVEIVEKYIGDDDK